MWNEVWFCVKILFFVFLLVFADAFAAAVVDVLTGSHLAGQVAYIVIVFLNIPLVVWFCENVVERWIE